MTTFKVGEIAIMQNCFQLENEGRECTIIHPLALRKTALAGTVSCYIVESATGIGACQPHQLRKRRPPSTDDAESRQAMLDCIERAKRPAMEPA